MAWNRKLSQLNDALADLAYTQAAITRIAQDAGLSPSKINYSGNASEIWHSVINELDKRGEVEKLFDVAKRQFPDNPFLKAATSPEDVDYSIAPELDRSSGWNEPDYNELEVLTMEKSTLLPISFLELGMVRARSVAKVEIKKGTSKNVGTGFLAKFPDNDNVFFITNYHVISEKNKIPFTNIIFNYEDTLDGGSKETDIFRINPGGVWITSPIQELDLSVFQLLDNEKTLNKYGFIQLIEIETNRNEFVNIIQHPGGQSKQLGLYHNVVTSSSEKVIQYFNGYFEGVLRRTGI